MSNFHDIEIGYISNETARAAIKKFHYMKTYPSGAKVNIGMMDKGRLVGLIVFGYSSATDAKVERLVPGMKRNEFLELQRMWISDAYGHNSESFWMSRIMKKLKRELGIRLIVTHAGGCKNDCGIVYQASGFLYFGKQPSSDFFLTEAGEYKNIIAPMRFGRVSSKDKTPQEVGEELFGPGEIVYANRYFYAYPLDKKLRAQLEPKGLEFPKDSSNFRKDQKWQNAEAVLNGKR